MVEVIGFLLLALTIGTLELQRERWEHAAERKMDHVRVIQFVETIARTGPERAAVAIPAGWTAAETHRLITAFSAARDRLDGDPVT